MKNLAILIAVGLLLVAGTLFFALRYFDGPATETHYKRGLSYDLDNHRVKALGLKLAIDTVNRQDYTVDLDFTLTLRQDVSINSVTALIRRPADSTAITPHVSPFSLQKTPITIHLSFNTGARGFFLLDAAVTVKGNGQPVFLQKSFFIK